MENEREKDGERQWRGEQKRGDMVLRKKQRNIQI